MKKLLVVVDMQNDFIDMALGTPEAQAIVPAVINKIKAWEGGTAATLDTHTEDYLSTREGRYLPVPHCIKGTEGHRIKDSVLDALNEKKNTEYIEKPTFGSEQLVEYVREKHFEHVELIGLCTDICVVSNALLLKNHFPEMSIAVDKSCCAGVTPESHDAALLAMKMCQVDII